jgi:hypothetical protein
MILERQENRRPAVAPKKRPPPVWITDHGRFEKEAHLASLAAPYRHARLSAMKLAGDPE